MRWLLWWRPPCLLKRCIVNLQSDKSTALSGVLWSSRGPWLTLRDVSAMRTGGAPTQVDGDVVIHRSNVEFIQVVPN
jgi:hypothetical protein